MGYCSEVSIAIKNSDYQRLRKDLAKFCAASPDDAYAWPDLLDSCEKFAARDGRIVLYWDSIKWYADYFSGVAFVMDKLRTLDDVDFLRVGEDPDDIEEFGTSRLGAPFAPTVHIEFTEHVVPA